MATPSVVTESVARAAEVRAELYGNPDEMVEETSPAATEEKPRVDPEDYKERFSRYKATTDSTIHGLRNELSLERDRNGELAGRLKTLEEVIASNPAQPGTGFQLSEDELELLDEETAAVVAKIVDASVKPLKERQQFTDGELERERNLRQAEGVKKLHLDFQDRLTTRVPNALELDADPAFRKWLSQVDPDSGRVRLELARAAKQIDDVKRVATFYEDWIAEQGRADPREEMISPNRAADAGQGAPTGRNWSRDEIKSFYTAKRERRVTPDEVKRIEQDIFAAQREGRIR